MVINGIGIGIGFGNVDIKTNSYLLQWDNNTQILWDNYDEIQL